jgi:hypothetical protein
MDKPFQCVSVGYLITKPTPRPGHLSKEEFPEKIFSASKDVAQFFPDEWAIPWSRMDEQQRRHRAHAFGINNEQRAAVTAWCRERFSVEYGWPNVIFSLDTARSLKAQYLRDNEDVAILGVGLHRSLARDFGRIGPPPRQEPGFAPVGKSGIYEAFLRGAEIEDGTPLGFELIEYRQGFARTWLCSEEFDRSAGVNKYGLIDDFDEAMRRIGRLSQSSIKQWLPWLLVSCG